MYKYLLIFLVTFCYGTFGLRSVDSHLEPSDVQRLQKVFIESLTSNDLQSIYFATLNLANFKAEDQKNLCSTIRKLHGESKLNNFEKDFYLIGANKNLRCPEKLPETLLTSVYAALKKDALATAQEIYYRVATHKLLDVQIDESSTARIVKLLQDILKKDDSSVSLGYAFNVAPELGATASFVADRIEDAVVQADEVDNIMLQFEGGLSITALVVNGAYSVAKTFNKKSPFNAEQAVKLANYFLGRRSVQTAKGAHLLIEALKSLLTIPETAPVCIQLIGKGQLDASSPALSIAVVDLFGKPVKRDTQNIHGKIIIKKDKTVLAEKVQFVSKSSDLTTYVADLSSYKPGRGIYLAEINVDNKFKQNLQFKILGRVKVHSFEIGVAESDTSSSLKKQSVVYPNTLKETLSADNTQKILLKTLLLDEGTTKVITVHQAFVRFYNKETNKEIIFVTEQDSNKAYKLDLDVGSRAPDFAYKSGLYEIYLIIGDASLSNSFQWHVANVQLKYAQERKDTKREPVRAPLPEIIHQFREPEKRPPRIVSDIFTGLCLLPLVLLFIFWGKLGVNVSDFTFAPSTIGFHLGFGGILVLFFIFWLKLNMFETLRLLLPIALFTFLCGNRLLRRIYADRIAKSPTS